MSERILIHAGEQRLEAVLNDSRTAQAIAAALPVEFHGGTWGDEIYGAIPVDCPPEDGTINVSVGDLAYWPPGSAFCIFYGPTPASTDEKPVPASDVVPIGHIDGDATVLRGTSSGPVRIEAR